MDRRGGSFSGDGEAAGAGWSAEEAFAALPEVVDAIVGAPWWQYGEDVVKARIGLLSRVENQVVAAQVAGLGEAFGRGLPVGSGFGSGGAWLRGLVNLTAGAAAQRAGLAEDRGREDLAPTRELFGAGDIGVGQAAAVTRTMTALDAIPQVDEVTWDEAQALLLREAKRLDAQALARVGVHLRNRLDPDAADRLAGDEEAQREARQATLSQQRSGMWWLTATLPATDGALLATALDVLAQPHPAGPVGEGGEDGGVDGGVDGRVDGRSGAQRRADALVGLAELSLAQRQGQPGGLPSRHGTPVRMLVTADITTLLADPTRRHGAAGVPPAVIDTGEPGGWDVSVVQAQTLFCDAETVPAVLDGAGRALDVGDSVYRFPPRIRRAVEIRDGHCSFPGCTAPPPWCHTHHLVPFGRHGQPGGPTAEANGTLLCGRHHRLVHASRWTGALIDGHVIWTPPRPGAPPAEPNDHTRQLQTQLRHLAHRWLARNPHIHASG